MIRVVLLLTLKLETLITLVSEVYGRAAVDWFVIIHAHVIELMYPFPACASTSWISIS